MAATVLSAWENRCWKVGTATVVPTGRGHDRRANANPQASGGRTWPPRRAVPRRGAGQGGLAARGGPRSPERSQGQELEGDTSVSRDVSDLRLTGLGKELRPDP